MSLIDVDQVQLATQTGRLDLLSAVLACLAIVIVFSGVYSFIHFRGVARNTARDETRKIAERVAVEFLQNELPRMMEDYRRLAESALTSEQADRIAEAQNEGEVGHEGDK